VTRPYRPSNGSEGMAFRAKFCDKCVKDDPDNEVYCPILCMAMGYAIYDSNYPKEWVMDDWDGKTPFPLHSCKCTAFQERK